MRYIEAPQNYAPRPGDPPALFLAGGISGCENWQAQACELLADAPVVVFNPRRADFDVADSAAAYKQIAWEYHHLRRADVTLFWFPACDRSVTVQPIALFELGATLEGANCYGRRLVVGVDQGYPRLFDVIEQCRHARPGLAVHISLQETVSAALEELAELIGKPA